MILIMARRFLEEDEIDRLIMLCAAFGQEFSVRFLQLTSKGQEKCLTRKMHKLIFNVPRFVRRWKTICMFSEQEGESKHAAVKAELSSLSNVRSHKDRIRLAMEREELRSTMDKSIMKPIPRICSVCLYRVFLGNVKLARLLSQALTML